MNHSETLRAGTVDARQRTNPADLAQGHEAPGSAPPDVLLSARNLSVRFGGVLAVNNVSFDVRHGEVFTLIGPNGAGKTTVFNLISRIYTPTSGSIEFEGKVLTQQPPHKIASLGIARTFQNIELFEHATVLHNMLIGRHIHRRTGLWSDLLFTGKARRAEIEAREKVEQVIDFLHLQHYRDSMVAGLPYGVRKVVELARALCTQPKLLLLDEPSSGLNVEETEDMAFWIQDIKHELGITVLMVEHDMTLVSKVSDRVLAMNQGETLAMGTPREVQNHPGVIEAYLGSVEDMSSLRRGAA
jgi:branched-chain amino acid transport system ATP-binding protein